MLNWVTSCVQYESLVLTIHSFHIFIWIFLVRAVFTFRMFDIFKQAS